VGRSANWSEDVLAAMKARSIATVCTIPDQIPIAPAYLQ